MPELPEVETVKVGLSKLLPGLEIKDVWHDWAKSFPNAPADVARFMVGAKIKTVRRRAKVLIIELSSDYSLVIHLKMTGQLVFVGRADKKIGEKRLAKSEESKIPKSQIANPEKPNSLAADTPQTRCWANYQTKAQGWSFILMIRLNFSSTINASSAG
ncbi:hypothetical protein HY380_00865 [Candidatus Saccharibacteria bacterium]|nr:hypothetical protein [Candidatus Saccharibacteria bacterium]